MRSATVTALVAALLGASPSEPPSRPTSQGLARTSSVQLPAGTRLRAAQVADVNGDGTPDVVAIVSPDQGELGRSALFYARDARSRAFPREPTSRLDLTEDVVAWAMADVHPDAGDELVLLTATGAFVWRPRASEPRERFARLFEADLLWQIPEERTIYTWQDGVADLDGDGLADLLLPEPGGYRIGIQRRGDAGPTFESSSLRLPPEPAPDESTFRVSGDTGVSSRDDRRPELAIQIRVGSNEDPALFRVTDRVPAPVLADWDGDGDIDVLGQGARHLFVWVQDAGRFPSEPTHALLLPVTTEERRHLDVSYSALARDVDGDRRADCLILSGDKRSRDVRTQLQVFTQAATPPLFGEKGLPRQLLVLAGFAAQPSLDDVNGDGLPDLVIGSLRPDLIDSLRSASSKKIEVELYVYLNGKQGFSKSPDLSHGISIPVDAERVVTRFFGDVTGDGVSDLFTRHEPERLRVFLTRVDRNGAWTVFDKPVWELAVDPRAYVSLNVGSGKQAPSALVLEPGQVLLIEFGEKP